MRKIKLHTKISLLLSALMISSMSLRAGETFRGEVFDPDVQHKETLSSIFVQQVVFQFDPENFNEIVKENGEFFDFTLEVGSSYSWEISLYKNEMRSPDYRAEETGEYGRVEVPKGECITYAGFTDGIIEQDVRLNIEKHRVWGYVTDKDGVYHIEPLNRFIEHANSESYVLYQPEWVIPLENAICGAGPDSYLDESKQPHSANLPTSNKSTGNDCRVLEIATESDWEFYDDGYTFSDILGNLNMVEGIYNSYFSINFVVVYQHQWTTSSDPYTTNDACMASPSVLDQFLVEWMNNFSFVKRDINVLYSQRDFTSPSIGCAKIGDFGDGLDNDGTVSGSNIDGAYSVNEWNYNGLASTDNGRKQLIAHEMGHNFGAQHDDSNCGIFSAGNIMCSAINYASSSFNATAVTEIEAIMNHISAEPNDGRTALRERFFENITPLLNSAGTYTYSGNVLTFEGTVNSVVALGGLADIKAQAVDNVTFLPGASIQGSASQIFSAYIGSCNLSSAKHTQQEASEAMNLTNDLGQLISIYPNPFTNQTTIELDVTTDDTQVTVEVFDVVGKRVALLANNETMSIGKHRLIFQTDKAAGSFFLARIRIGEQEFVEKIVRME